MLGTSLAQYKILEELGRGGMGIVYRAEDTNLHRQVAIKVLPPQVVTSDEDTARFRREAQAAAALNHPNIATVHDLGQTDDGQTYIVMELIEGEDLSDRIERGPLGVDEAVTLSRQIADALQAAHEAGIVHRDIKPSNISLTRKGTAKVLDFGLSKIAGGAVITKSRSTLGTAAYMSPEQARGDETDSGSDIWSLGVVMYEMLTGARPFKGEYEAAVAYNIVNSEVEPPSAVNPDIPEALSDIVVRTLRKKPEDRFASMGELEQALAALQGPAATAAPASAKSVLSRPVVWIPSALGVIALVALALWWNGRQERVLWARQVALPEIERLAELTSYREAFDLAVEAEAVIPGDTVLAGLWPEFSFPRTIHTDPPGADVYVRPYGTPTGAGTFIGQTPIDSLQYPDVRDVFRIELNGYVPVQQLIRSSNYAIALKEVGSENADMILVPEVTDNIYNLLPVGLDHVGREPLNAFLIDPYEVSNREYKAFLDAGGYNQAEYWIHPFILDGRELSWEDAMSRFVDRTGRPGPATWEVQDYPDGQENYPVTGVSWYEAAAYASFAGKELPTVFHWARAAYIPYSDSMVPASNLNGSEPAARGASLGISRYGAYDMAGNAREWTVNPTGSPEERYILGGGWNDPDYGFTDAFAQSALDRSPTNGFRCMVYLEDDPNRATLTGALTRAYRDYYAEEPVSDAEFALIRRQFAYDRTPLNAQVDEVDDSEPDWTREKVSFDAAYGNERVVAYLFLPKRSSPPYQTVVYFPGSGSISLTNSENLSPEWFDFMLKSGRAFIWPIYKGTYERGTDLRDDYGNESVFYKDHVIMWAQDLQRTVDYLESREDVDPDKFSFFGVSWGAANGPIMTSIENRFKASILFVAGLYPSRVLPEADPFNFLPRSTLPTIMLNGRYDFFFPYETTQVPFFEHLGTPDDQKEFYVSEGGHNVPREELISRSLAWLDRYVGPVN